MDAERRRMSHSARSAAASADASKALAAAVRAAKDCGGAEEGGEGGTDGAEMEATVLLMEATVLLLEATVLRGTNEYAYGGGPTNSGCMHANDRKCTRRHDAHTHTHNVQNGSAKIKE